MTPLTGLVLAGGASRRMGHDKALLRRDGRTLLERTVDVLTPLCGRVLVASGDGRRLPGPWTQVADAPPDVGPVGGLLAGLRAADTALVAVLAVDLAEPSGALLAWLAGRWNGVSPAVVPVAHGRVQPLHAVYATTAAEDLARLVATGERSLIRLLDTLGAQRVPPQTWAGTAPSDFARNLNTPAQAQDVGVVLPQSPEGSV